jgi:uncharacterized protein
MQPKTQKGGQKRKAPPPRQQTRAQAARPAEGNGHGPANQSAAQLEAHKQAARKFVWDQLLAASRRPRTRNAAMALDGLVRNPYEQSVPRPPPWAYRGSDIDPKQVIAMDQNVNEVATWAGGLWNEMLGGVPAEGTTFMGYQYLSELAQRAEYRRACETIANEATRKWIKIQASGKEDKTDKIKELNEELARLDLRRVLREAMLQDGFFGRSHIYIDLQINGRSVSDDRDELRTNIGDGRDAISRAKITKGSLKAIRTVEAVWVYPMNYDSIDPLKPSWYNPQTWFVMGKEVHASRLLRFVGREVPDLIKPLYSFGGLALIQMMIPYVNNWLRTRQSVSDITHAYSVFVLATDLEATLNIGGDQIFKRAEVFNNFRDNLGLMLVNKDTEELTNVAVSLGSLDKLQAQAQEQMAAVCAIPLVKLLGLSPAGLNATAEPELRSFYDWIHSYQELFFNTNLWRIFRMAQLNIWGDIDESLTFAYEQLWALSEEELTKARKDEAETDQLLVDIGAVSPMEVRQRLAADPDAPYASLDIEDVPNLKQEEEQGLEPKGGRPQPVAGKAEGGEVTGEPTGSAGAPPGQEDETADMDMGGPAPLDDATKAEKLGRLLHEMTREDREPPGERYLKFAAIMDMLLEGTQGQGYAERMQKFVKLLTHSEAPSERAQKLARFLGQSGKPGERTLKLAKLLAGSKTAPSERIRRLARILLANQDEGPVAADVQPYEAEPAKGPEDLEDVERETDPNLAPSAVSGVDAQEDIDPLNPLDAGSNGSGGGVFGEKTETPDPTADPRESTILSPEIDGTATDGKLDVMHEHAEMPGTDPRTDTQEPDRTVEKPVDPLATDSKMKNSRKPRPTFKIKRSQ